MKVKYFVLIFIMLIGVMPGFNMKTGFYLNCMSIKAQPVINPEPGGVYIGQTLIGYASGKTQGFFDIGGKKEGIYYFSVESGSKFQVWKGNQKEEVEDYDAIPLDGAIFPKKEEDNNGEGLGSKENTDATNPPSKDTTNGSSKDTGKDIIGDPGTNPPDSGGGVDNPPPMPDPLPTPPEEPIPPLITLPPDDDPNKPCATLTITGKLVKSPIGKNEGEITNLKAFNGTAPYAFSLDGKTALVGGSFTELASGNHTVNVTDAKGCTGSNTFKIDNCPTDANFTVTADMLKEINPSGYKIDPSGHSFSQEEIDNIFQQTAYYINKYMKNYEINTRQRLAYFLANASEETDNFRSFIERWNFSRDAIIKTWSRSLFPLEIIDKYVNCICVLDRAYADDGKGHNNGDEASKDGSKYRGRGLFHMTHKDSYYRFTNYYQKKYNDYTKDFVNNPDLIANATTSKTEVDFNLSVLAALWEFSVDKSKDKNGNSLPTNRNALLAADNDDLNLITSIINGGDNGLDIRKKKLEIAKRILCLK